MRFNGDSRFTNIRFLLPCLVLSGCMQSMPVVNSGQPDWISGDSPSYPNVQYVVASGSASNAEQAKDRALANLSKVFELHIRDSSTTRPNVQVVKQNGAESVSKSQSRAQNVNIQTNKIIDGVRIAQQWQSPDLSHYALAVLDRHQAGNNIRGEITRLDEQAGFELNSVATKKNILQKVAVYQRVLTLQDQRDALQKTLKVIDLSGQGVESKWNRAELRADLEASLTALNMKPEILHDDVGGLDKVLRGAMSKSGFPETTGTETGHALSAGLVVQPPIVSQGWHWLRGTLTLRLSSAGGQVLGNKTWPLKVSASSKAELNQRMIASVEKKLNHGLRAALMDFATIE